MRKKISILYVVSVFLAVSMLCMACGAKASTMKLARSEGSFVVRNEKAKELEPFSDMNLYSGHQMETNLRSLFLDGNQTSDIFASPLSGLTQLIYLNLGNNQISDISALAGLQSLDNLFLDNNQIHDISVLADLPSLTTLDLRNNQIDDFSALDDRDELHTLMLD